VADATGTTLPAAALADNYVFSCGELDYIELFVRAHVLGRTFRNASGWAYVVQPEKAVR
jgi:hypothetical protein